MKTNTFWKRLVVVVALGLALLGIPAYLASGVSAVGTSGGNAVHKPAGASQASSTLSDDISVASTDVVMDWNAIMQTTVAPANPFSQARSAAIVQLAVFEA